MGPAVAGKPGEIITGHTAETSRFVSCLSDATMSGHNGSIINRNVLMLNQNYEPLTICSARRAIVLLFQGKAEMIETADGLKVHSISREFALPSVVRLQRYRRVPFKRIMLTRKNVITRDGHRCQYCGATRGAMTIDHVIPRKVGGNDTWENMVCACVACNNKKGDHTPEHVGMSLLRKPTRPSHIAFIQRHVSSADHRWRQYLFMD
jgi:5-methylcytosine-specific restriction endonuclease McrA